MENECEIYLDPDEDEVFFGCVSDREKSLSAKIETNSGLSAKDELKLTKVLDEVIVIDDDDGEKNNKLKDQEIVDICNEVSSTNITTVNSDLNKSFENERDSCKNHSNNSSVELEHNYSTPMKHKIDKSILTTPKSVVKADRDGGFLKVLSEIALVKAEAEADSTVEDKKEDEDKENMRVQQIPDINIIEATPEKSSVFSPPKSVKAELRRFRIIYNSPQNEDNVHYKSVELERNIKNNTFNQDVKKNSQLINLIGQENNEIEGTDEVGVEGSQVVTSSSPRSPEKVSTPMPKRFSKDARKIIEVLKKSSFDDTLNFTIPEIDIEEENNSFISPEPVPAFDDTIIAKEIPEVKPEKLPVRTPSDKRVLIKSKTVEKDRRNVTPVVSRSKIPPMRYLSERRVYNQVDKGCAKKLPMEEKKTATSEKVIGAKVVDSCSKIPVFGSKNSKIPLSGSRPLTAKTTPLKTPLRQKNPKFNHIESPINAYINNKPTSLVQNVKPDLKKDSMTKILKAQTFGSAQKPNDKTPAPSKPKSAIRLPFVEYKSATPYKIEKKPESRLPRLAPTVYKLIGSHSPKVLKHEGRFFVNSVKKGASSENTIVADANEVSVVLSQPAQKTNTIK